MQHFLDGHRGQLPFPPAHHLGLSRGHAALVDIALQRIAGKQVHARQPVLQL